MSAGTNIGLPAKWAFGVFSAPSLTGPDPPNWRSTINQFVLGLLAGFVIGWIIEWIVDWPSLARIRHPFYRHAAPLDNLGESNQKELALLDSQPSEDD